MFLFGTWQKRILKGIEPRGRVWGVSVWVSGSRYGKTSGEEVNPMRYLDSRGN